MPQKSEYISTLKRIIDHEISHEAEKRDYHLLKHSIDEYLRATNVNLEELDLAAECYKNKFLARIREQVVSVSNNGNM